MGDPGVEVWTGCVNPWECDVMGHMNVRFYVAKTMEGLGGLAALLGMPRAFAPRAQATLIVREQHIRFLREARAGAGLYMTAGVVEMGETDARLLMVLRHLSGEPAAAFQTVVSHVTAADGAPFAWPESIRRRAEVLRVEVPDYAAPRSLGVQPVETRASLERAEALGLVRTGAGLVGAQDCDVFGRMRTELFVARASDGVPRMAAAAPASVAPALPARLGGALLEYRLIYLDWARAGDRLDLRSGLAGCDARLRRIVHWLFNPDTGRPLAVGEAIAANLDLDARKIVSLSPQAQAAVAAQVISGLTL